MKKVVGILILCMSLMSVKAQVKIDFEVSFIEPQAHYAEVEMNISGLVNKEYVDVKMPVWAPGSYLVREFAKNVENFSASVPGKQLAFEKIRKNTWRVFHAKNKSLKIKYRVYAFEVSVRTSFVDESHAFLSSTGIFMYPDGMIKQPSTVKIVPFATWTKVSTGLAPVAGKPFTYFAADFDILFDSPIEVGNQDVFEFQAAGVRHEVAMYGGGNYDKERLKVDMAKIVEAGTAIFGENPNKHYTFIVHNYQRGSGGLEHLNSTVLGASRNGYTNERAYNGFLNLVAHEYFHLWNVKRLRPIALGPFDYDNENYTTNLWTAEGFTSYYATKLLLRTGALDKAAFLNDIMGSLGTVINSPGAKVQSLASSSFDAWIIGYRPNENSNNSSISYYTKGEVIGWVMDLEIAQATKGSKSLDDVMKAMYLQGKQLKRGYTDAEFKAMVEKVSGISFTNFWKKYINGTDDVDFAKYLAFAGISAKAELAKPNSPYLGAGISLGNRVSVTSVRRSSPAWKSGLNVNDVIISIDNKSLKELLSEMTFVPSAMSLDALSQVASKKVGDSVAIKISRDGVEKDLVLKIEENPSLRIKAEYLQNPSEQQAAVQKGWMGL